MRGWLGGGAAGIKTTIYVNFVRQLVSIVSICGLEECATHIGNPQMRGRLGGGAAGHRTTRIVFGITNKERTRCSVSIPRMIILQSIHPLSR